MNILITGASGFVGSRLLTMAAQRFGNANVTALTSKAISGYKCIIAENQDLSTLSNQVFSEVDVLIHAGAFTPKNAKEANCLASCNKNITYTEQLLGFQFNRLKKIIYTSTLDVYGESNCISESTETKPATLYGASKLYCEKMISAYGADKGIGTQILRLGHIYGPGEEKYQKMLPLTIKNVLLDKPVEIWGGGGELRSFIFIDDVVSAIIHSIEWKSDNDVINVVGGVSLSIRELVEKIITISGKSVDIVFREAPSNGKNFVFDNRLLKDTLLRTETDFDSGLEVEYRYMESKLNVR
ncbi:NAD(P)-dependent oxidoreductase [Pseudomonas sp. SG20052]|uniref:NAD-dependent epimerase/dehydratase family protein n=1 Tax=Pseudomonas sp. SG20052 TaxID=3074147 RepID=UPI00287F620C|nr:NAD(P)-dependent oxidoreductase [Pseudomonas sp. SG20052]WNF57339.1 NAD(P)-dependent oxidoreductase [Pseudomonas sp. SG20052]